MPKLYEIERGSIIYEKAVALTDDGEIESHAIRFQNLDGAYSYCTGLDKDLNTILVNGTDMVVHLSASVDLVEHEDGYKLA